ncbi:MAG: hypothetical protein JSU69_04360 [Candidatus Zixiibacteriota bacterium]|nr:MAG: hypothetical protein JSU69_04360 [candidate division Zixibacteria bacterium]
MRGIRNLLARLRLKMLCRKYRPSAISLPGGLRGLKNILVCLPPGQRELTMVKQFLPDLSRIFAESEIYLMASPGSSVYDIFPRKGYRIMTPSSDHVDWKGMASRKYLRLLKENEYGLILDFNLSPNHFSQSVLLSFPDAVRIGKGNSLGTPYYNLEIKTRYIRDEKNIYKSMVLTIDKLKNPAPAETNRNVR